MRRFPKPKKIYDTYDYTVPGCKELHQILVADRRCYGRFAQNSIVHRLTFDEFDEFCLKYIIEREDYIDSALVTRGRIHHDYVFKESYRTHCRYVIEVEVTHGESGNKMWMPIGFLPNFSYSLIDPEDGRYDISYPYELYKKFCENNENWEWVSEHTPAPKFIEVKEYGSQEPVHGKKKK